MSKKGFKNQRGEPELYDELKKRITLAVTPTGVEGLDAIASSLGLSRSELVERIGRGLIGLDLNSLSEAEREALKKLSES